MAHYCCLTINFFDIRMAEWFSCWFIVLFYKSFAYLSKIFIFTIFGTNIFLHFVICSLLFIFYWCIADGHILGVYMIYWYIHKMFKDEIRVFGLSITLNINIFFFILETIKLFSSSYFVMYNRLLLIMVTLLICQTLGLISSI